MGNIQCFVPVSFWFSTHRQNNFNFLQEYKNLICPSYCFKMDMLSNLQQQRIMVEQLRREAAIKRVNVSQAIEDIKKYISDHESEDYLLVGFPSQKSNPFREKSSCNVL